MIGIRGCELGYEEHDGFQYCFRHAGFRNPGSCNSWCDRAPVPTTEDPVDAIVDAPASAAVEDVTP